MLALLERVETQALVVEDGGGLDLAVALERLRRAMAAVKAELLAEFDAHVEQQAAYWLVRHEATGARLA